MYDKTTFLSGLAIGLCSKGNPTFEGSGKMLYNGVELPALPEWDKVKYPYAYITDGGVVARDRRLLRCTDTPLYAWHYEDTSMGDLFSGVSSYGVVAHYLGYRYDADSETWEFRAQSSLIFSHVYLPIWCNTDMEEIIKKDETDELTGAIGLYASDPVPVEDTFVKGYHAGAELRRKRRLPVAYLYNGVRLPKLPEWDKETYPYAYIGERTGSAEYLGQVVLWFTKKEASISDGGMLFNMLSSNARYYLYNEDTNEWNSFEQSLAATMRAFWTNTNILNDDDSVYLAASKPVPVYE